MSNKDDKLNFIVENQHQGLKLNDYFRSVLKFSSRFTQKSVRGGKVKLNNDKCTLFTKLNAGDNIEIYIEREEDQDILAEKMHLDIIYEDKDIIVVNKPAGIVVHPTRRHPMGTLANGLLYHFRENGENCIVRLVSRLDMDTSGLILVAKNAFSHMALARDMHREEFVKTYLAVVHGSFQEKKGTINRPIYKLEDGTIKRIVHEKGQKSITHYEVIDTFSEGSLVKLVLETGRTHQIRVHLSDIGNPIYGDALYGVMEDEYIGRQALHAFELQIIHPRTGEVLKFQSQLPEDIKKLLARLK